jgi:hypothetical protein
MGELYIRNYAKNGRQEQRRTGDGETGRKGAEEKR